MTFPKPYDPLESSNMVILYGAGPMFPEQRWPDATCPDCGASLLGGSICWECAKKRTGKIDPPPPYAADVETAAIDALGRLNPEQAARVIAWACGRFGVPGPVAVEVRKQFVDAINGPLPKGKRRTKKKAGRR